MLTAGVVIDSWKLDIFTKVLDKAGFEYRQMEGPVKDSILLSVKTESQAALLPHIKQANATAARTKMH